MMDEQKKISINLPPDMMEGVYANLAMITHSDCEFTLDFIRTAPGLASPVVKSRVVMSPPNAKRLLAALQANVQIFEKKHGIIRDAPADDPNNLRFNMN